MQRCAPQTSHTPIYLFSYSHYTHTKVQHTARTPTHTKKNPHTRFPHTCSQHCTHTHSTRMQPHARKTHCGLMPTPQSVHTSTTRNTKTLRSHSRTLSHHTRHAVVLATDTVLFTLTLLPFLPTRFCLLPGYDITYYFLGRMGFVTYVKNNFLQKLGEIRALTPTHHCLPNAPTRTPTHHRTRCGICV